MDMQVQYPENGYFQQESLYAACDQKLGNVFNVRTVDKAAFGRRVAERRAELGLSQVELAKLAGMRQQGMPR